MATKKTLYVKDEDLPLWSEYKDFVEDKKKADSVSDLVTQAMRSYLTVLAAREAEAREDEARAAAADSAFCELDRQMERVEICASRNGKGDPRNYVFTGTQLASDDSTEVYAWLTRQHRILALDERHQAFYVYDHVDELDPDMWGGEFVADIAEAMGDERPIELDI